MARELPEVESSSEQAHASELETREHPAWVATANVQGIQGQEAGHRRRTVAKAEIQYNSSDGV